MQNITTNCATLLVNGNAIRLTTAAQGVHHGLSDAGTLRPESRRPMALRDVGKRPVAGSLPPSSSESGSSSERSKPSCLGYRGDAANLLAAAASAVREEMRRSDRLGVDHAIAAAGAPAAAAARTRARVQKAEAAKLPAPIWAAS